MKSVFSSADQQTITQVQYSLGVIAQDLVNKGLAIRVATCLSANSVDGVHSAFEFLAVTDDIPACAEAINAMAFYREGFPALTLPVLSDQPHADVQMEYADLFIFHLTNGKSAFVRRAGPIMLHQPNNRITIH